MTLRSSGPFSGGKLRLARTFRGLTRAELGQRVSVSNQFLHQLEFGTRTPSRELLDALAEELGFEPRFFLSPIEEEFRDEEANWRRRKSTPQNVRLRALAQGTLFGMAVAYADSALTLPPDRIPKFAITSERDIEHISALCRLHWGLGGDRPIGSVARVLENAGAAIAVLDKASEKVDAFSRPGRRNVVVLNNAKGSTSRARFDMAHELGHLVMHVGLETGTPEHESEADQFASAFLLPANAFRREFPDGPRIRWPEMVQFKARWKVSIGAIVHRAHDLGIWDASRYRNACIYIRKMNWHKGGEPGEEFVPAERPELVTLAFAALRETFGQGPTDVAATLGWKPRTFHEVTGVPEPPKRQEIDEGVSSVVSLEHFRNKGSAAKTPPS